VILDNETENGMKDEALISDLRDEDEKTEEYGKVNLYPPRKTLVTSFQAACRSALPFESANGGGLVPD
jgi:hypothetical protein